MQSKWRHVTSRTSKLAVPGGWLYRVTASDYESDSVTFVPDPSAEHVVAARVDDLLLAGNALAELAPDYAGCEDALQEALDAWHRISVYSRKGGNQ